MMELGSKVIVLENDEPRVPSEEEVKEYAAFLGIDPDTEPHLMWIAWEGVAAPVPPPWKACHNTEAENEEEIFYFNFETAESVWDHPCDEKYRQLVDKARSEGLTGPPSQRPAADGGGAAAEAAKAAEDASDLSVSGQDGADLSLSGPEAVLGNIAEADEEFDSSAAGDDDEPKAEAGTDKPEEDKKDTKAHDADDARSSSSAAGVQAKPKVGGLTKQTGPGLSAAAKKDALDESGSHSAPSSPREGADASGSQPMSAAAAEAERKRLSQNGYG